VKKGRMNGEGSEYRHMDSDRTEEEEELDNRGRRKKAPGAAASKAA